MKKIAVITGLLLAFACALYAGPDMLSFKITPNPFSPLRGPAAINYQFTSSVAVNVMATIKIYNMAGELIRVVVDKQPRQAGVALTDYWDGKDKKNHWASNGRYILQVELKDTTGTKQYLYSVAIAK